MKGKTQNSQSPYQDKLFCEKEKIRGRIFSHVRPFYEQAVSDLDP
jgi:hypothetical protein